MSGPDIAAITALLRTLPRQPADDQNIEYWATRLRVQALKMPQAWCVESIALGQPDPDRAKLRPQLQAVAKAVTDLADALERLSPEGWEALDDAEMEQQRLGHVGDEELHVTEALHAIRTRRDRIAVTIGLGDRANPKRGSGRGAPGRRTFVQMLVETFEGITGRKPTRIVGIDGSDKEGEETGPFFEFVSAMVALFQFPASSETVARRAVDFANERKRVVRKTAPHRGMDASSKNTDEPSIGRVS